MLLLRSHDRITGCDLLVRAERGRGLRPRVVSAAVRAGTHLLSGERTVLTRNSSMRAQMLPTQYRVRAGHLTCVRAVLRLRTHPRLYA